MKSKTVAVIDGGGRGHALVDKYLQSKEVIKVIAVPGNDLMLLSKNVKIFPQFKTTDIDQIVLICRKEKVDLVDVAQDDAVAAGIVDELKKQNIKTFGPTKAAGQIEWDKAWARKFMKKFHIPSPKYKIFKTRKEGINYIKKQKEGKWFVKASGLAAGKGALYAENNHQAINKINQMKNFGKAGETYLIEECLEGEEFSSFAIVNGERFEIAGYAQDHKRLFDNDKGPNTGGMGCSSPPMVITKEIEKQVRKIFKKTVMGLFKIKRPYTGVLYLGGIIVNGQVNVIEFNARWGDPEAQVIIPSIKNDLFSLKGLVLKAKRVKLEKDDNYRIVVAAASKGYPGNYSKIVGKEIKNLGSIIRHAEQRERSIRIFGAGVKIKDKKYVASGGRLFYVMGEGKNVEEARKKAYDALSQVSISGNNLHYRRDIGYRDLERLTK